MGIIIVSAELAPSANHIPPGMSSITWLDRTIITTPQYNHYIMDTQSAANMARTILNLTERTEPIYVGTMLLRDVVKDLEMVGKRMSVELNVTTFWALKDRIEMSQNGRIWSYIKGALGPNGKQEDVFHPSLILLPGFAENFVIGFAESLPMTETGTDAYTEPQITALSEALRQAGNWANKYAHFDAFLFSNTKLSIISALDVRVGIIMYSIKESSLSRSQKRVIKGMLTMLQSNYTIYLSLKDRHSVMPDYARPNTTTKLTTRRSNASEIGFRLCFRAAVAIIGLLNYY